MNTHNITRWTIPAWSWPPIFCAIAAETLFNSMRAYSLGQHLDHGSVEALGRNISLVGAVMVLAAVAVSLFQTRAVWLAFTPGQLSRRLGAAAVAVLLLAVSVTAVSSHLFEAQRSKVADEGGARGAYDRAEQAYKAAAAEMEALGTPRPVSVIQAEVNAAKIDQWLWKRSKQCSDVTAPESKEACKPILDLYKERGAAARKAELEPDVERLRSELASLKRPEEVSASEGLVSIVWAWLMGFAIVSLATFSPVLAARVVTEPAKVEPVAEPVKAITERPQGEPLDEEIEELAKLLAKYKRELTNKELADKLKITKGEASKRKTKALEAGVIAERREGRNVYVSLARH